MFTFQNQDRPPCTPILVNRRSRTYNKRKIETHHQWEWPSGDKPAAGRENNRHAPTPSLSQLPPFPHSNGAAPSPRIDHGHQCGAECHLECWALLMAKGEAMGTQEEAEIVTRKPKHCLFNQCSLQRYKLKTWNEAASTAHRREVKAEFQRCTQYYAGSCKSYLLNTCHGQSTMFVPTEG